jgi:hypothetical protein
MNYPFQLMNIYNRNIIKMKLWNNEEIEFLLENYPKYVDKS